MSVIDEFIKGIKPEDRSFVAFFVCASVTIVGVAWAIAWCNTVNTANMIRSGHRWQGSSNDGSWTYRVDAPEKMQ